MCYTMPVIPVPGSTEGVLNPMRTKKLAAELFCVFASVLVLTAALSGCGRNGAAAEQTDPVTTIEPAGPSESAGPAGSAEPSEAEVKTGRQDGERFEAVILLEGMEETIHYEHVRNDTLGFEMDYDYESFVRRRESDRERFISVWDDPENPENYLEVTYRPEDADTVAASVSEALSHDYELLTESCVLDYAGSCVRIEASEIKGGGRMADLLQTVYIIPRADGCLVAAAHCSIEGAEGFGRRFSYIVNTLSPIEAP